jgi:hypothetical protein
MFPLGRAIFFSRKTTPHAAGRPTRTAPKGRPDDAELGRYALLGFQKSLKPREALYTLPSEPAPDRKHT